MSKKFRKDTECTISKDQTNVYHLIIALYCDVKVRKQIHKDVQTHKLKKVIMKAKDLAFLFDLI